MHDIVTYINFLHITTIIFDEGSTRKKTYHRVKHVNHGCK